MKHISIRVPWHDSNWNGHVCKNPACNTFCNLHVISMSRRLLACTLLRIGVYFHSMNVPFVQAKTVVL